MGAKACTKCGEIKDLGLFSKVKARGYAPSSHCKACVSESSRQRYLEKRDEILAKQREAIATEGPQRERRLKRAEEYRNKNRERICQSLKDWRIKNIEAVKEKDAIRYRENPVPKKEAAKRWIKRNPDKVLSFHAARRAAKKNACVAWADKTEVEGIYRHAEELRKSGAEVHVDHIVPLKSPIVCGLHNQFNLQILPASLNIQKSNRVWPDMP